MNEARFNLPLSADDPRLSEWLDGRLPEAEAAQVARLVAASPELTRLVTDLRRQKAALTALPAAPPPAGFVEDVLAALDADLASADDDAAVAAEWRRIERERLEEEIAEARAGAAEPADEPMRHRWPWMVLVGALAAGLLAAIVINRPGGPSDREVALAEKPREGKPWERQRGGNFKRQDPVDGTLLDAAEARDDDGLDTLATTSVGPGRAAARERPGGSGGGGEPNNPAGERGEALRNFTRAAKPSSAGAVAGGRDIAAGDGVADQGTRSALRPGGEADRQTGDGQRKTGKSESVLADAGGERAAAAAPPAAQTPFGTPGGFLAGGQLQRPVRTVTYRIRTAADRRRLDELVASSDGVARRSTSDSGKPGDVAQADGLDIHLQKRLAAPAEKSAGTGGPPTERLVLSGPPEALASLANALELPAGPERRRGADRTSRSGALDAAEAVQEKGGEFGKADRLSTAAVARTEGKNAAVVGEGGGAGLGGPPGSIPPGAPAGKHDKPAVLVIEIVDESGADGGESQP